MSGTLLVVRRPHRLEAWLISHSGRVIRDTVLVPTPDPSEPPTQSAPLLGTRLPSPHLPVPDRAVTIRPGLSGGFLVSDRFTTFFLTKDGKVSTLVEGGRGTFVGEDAAGQAVVVTYAAGRHTLYIWNARGVELTHVVEPLGEITNNAPPALGTNARLVPTSSGAGFVFETGSALLVPGQAGLRVQAFGTGTREFAPAGPTSGDAHLVNTRQGTRVGLWGQATLGVRFGLLPGFRELGLLDASGVLVAAKEGLLYALRPDGTVLTEAAGKAMAVAAGGG